MTTLDALKVAQEACLNEEHEESGFGPTDQSRRYSEAAAVLARLEAEWSELDKIASEMSMVIPGRSPIAIQVGGWLKRIDAILSRLDAAPKKGS